MDSKAFVSIAALAAATTVPAKTLAGNFRRGSMSPSTAKKIAESLGVSYLWLTSGHGQPFEALAIEPNAAMPSLSKENMSEPAPELYAYIKKAKTRLSAGGGTEAEEGFESERFGFLKSWLRQKATSTSDEILFLIDVEGDSMLPTFASKDMVLVDKGLAELRSEGYFAIGEGNFINIKRLKREGDSIQIISDNPDKSMYPTRIVDGEGLRIIGRVIWVGREIP
jgi:phage repressor protein C with HTH and peptisase S24 domain